MANKNDNLIPQAHVLTLEEQSAGGKASGEARRKKATMKKILEDMLDETNKKSGKTYKELATLGLIKGAMSGKADNYKTIVALLGELQESNETPQVNINIVDNSELEKALYEDNN